MPLINGEMRVIGLMSGSSLDGIDVAQCYFDFGPDPNNDRPLSWSIERAELYPYSPEWVERLRAAPTMSGRDLWQLHADLGRSYGAVCRHFLESGSGVVPSLIASHGHTVYHDPEAGFTIQIGDGVMIAAAAGLPVVDQLRSADMAAGGQGAPLAPLADELLFGQYDACLNLGGIANLSLRTPRGYVACDIGAAGQLLDHLAQQAGMAYDDGGRLAATGRFRADLSKQVDALPFFRLDYPKSLDNGWVRDRVIPLYDAVDAPPADKLRTACVQLANQLNAHLRRMQVRERMIPERTTQLMVAGGGALNDFLLTCIRESSGGGVEPLVIDRKTALFKEAALIALAGALRLRGLPNARASATGAERDTVNGAVYWG